MNGDEDMDNDAFEKEKERTACSFFEFT